MALLDTPLRTIDALLHEPASTVLPEALLAGWVRLARQDPDAAVDRYAQLVRTRNLTSESASAFALAVALPLAWRRDARAEEFFARVSTHELDDNALEWRARAAMWAGNWSLVTQSIATMSETNRQSARWRYWTARALDQTGDTAQAHRCSRRWPRMTTIIPGLPRPGWASRVSPHPQPLDRDEAVRAQLAQIPALVRAHELLLCELRDQAMTEWQFAFDELSPSRASAGHTVGSRLGLVRPGGDRSHHVAHFL